MNVSYRRTILPAAERESRDEAWAQAPTIAERYPRARRFAIAMSFQDPRAATQPSPMRQLYEPSMRALFELRCPLRDCSGGGFDLNAPIRSMLSNERLPRTGQSLCHGSRGRDSCGLELSYALTALDTAD